MDGHAEAAGDKAHDVVAGDGGAALGELHHALGHVGDDDTGDRLLVVALAGDAGVHGGPGSLGLLLPGGLLGGQTLGLLAVLVDHLFTGTVGALLGGGAAVADGGVHLLQGVEADLLQHMGEHLLGGDHGDVQAHPLEFTLKHGAALGHVLLPLFLLEPLADLGAGLVALGQLHPVTAGALGVLGGDDLHDLAGLELVVKAHDAAVDLGAGHGVADPGVDGVGKVDGGGTGGKGDHVGVGGKDEDFVGEEVHLQGADILFGVGVLLVFQQAADPGKGLLGAQLLLAHALLVLPVGGHAVFGHVVHVPGTDLDLEGDALGADDRGVKGLVHVGLGGADIVLEAAQNGLVHVVDAAQHAVAGGDVVHDDPEGVQVEDLA